MDRIYFIDYKGKQILIEDFTKLRTAEEFIPQLDIALKIIQSQPPHSVLAVLDATDSMFNNVTLDAVKKFSAATPQYIKASCVVGITGLLRVGLIAVSKFSGRDFKNFPSREAALEWLINQ